MLSRSLAALALLAAQALLALADPPYLYDVYEGPADVKPEVFFKFFLDDNQCGGDLTSLQNCDKPDALRVMFYDFIFVPKVTMSYDENHYFTQISLERLRDKQGNCKGKAIVYVYARCAQQDGDVREGGLQYVPMQAVHKIQQVPLRNV